MKHRAPRRGFLAGAAAGLAIALAAVPPMPVSAAPVAPEGPARVRLLAPLSTAGIPFLMLAGQQVAGATLKVDTFANHAQALALLLRGDVDLLYTGASQGWENWLDGSPIVVVATGCWGISSLVGSDRSIHGPADLRGKRIAMPFPGAPLDVQTRWLLRRAGLDPSRDVTISYGPFTQSIPLLLAGRLDAAALPEPQATTMVRRHADLGRLFLYADAWAAASGASRASPQITLFATAAWARGHRALLSALVDAWRQVSDRLSADPALALPYAAAVQADPAEIEEAVRGTLYEVPDFLEDQARILAYYETVRAELPTSDRSLDASFFFRP